MAQKITTNELKSLVKKILKEEAGAKYDDYESYNDYMRHGGFDDPRDPEGDIIDVYESDLQKLYDFEKIGDLVGEYQQNLKQEKNNLINALSGKFDRNHISEKLLRKALMGLLAYLPNTPHDPMGRSGIVDAVMAKIYK